MPDISHFMIPADDVGRAKAFYTSLFRWRIEPIHDTSGMPGMDTMQYHAIDTGKARLGALNTGGLYQRHMKEPVLTFVEVPDLDSVACRVETLGGKVLQPPQEIPGVGRVAMILDTEGNVIGLWSRARG